MPLSIHCIMKQAAMGMLAISLLLVSSISQGAIYHVAVNGNDQAFGNVSGPWKTLKRAIEAVSSGDEIVLHAGNYDGFMVKSNKPINLFRNWVTIRAAQGEEVTVGHVLVAAPGLDGKGDTQNTAYLRFKGLKFRDRIHIEGFRHVEILSCVINQAGNKNDTRDNITKAGVDFSGADLLVKDTEVTDTAIGMQIRGWRNKLVNCNIHHVFHDGIQLVDTRETIVDGCKVNHCDDGFADGDPASGFGNFHADCIHLMVSGSATRGVKNVAIRNCEIYACEGAGFQVNNFRDLVVDGVLLENNVFGVTGAPTINLGPIDNCTIRQNTFKHLEGGYSWGRFNGEKFPPNSYCNIGIRVKGCRNCFLYNNLLGRSSIELNSDGWTSTHNFYDERTYASFLALIGRFDVIGNPNFANDKMTDPALEADSPAINIGTRRDVPAGLPLPEYAINKVHRDNRPDAGAWEFPGLDPPLETPAPPLPSNPIVFVDDFQDGDITKSDPWLNAESTIGLRWSVVEGSWYIANYDEQSFLDPDKSGKETCTILADVQLSTPFTFSFEARSAYAEPGSGVVLFWKDENNYVFIDLIESNAYQVSDGNRKLIGRVPKGAFAAGKPELVSIEVKPNMKESIVLLNGRQIGVIPTDQSNRSSVQVGFRHVPMSKKSSRMQYTNVRIVTEKDK